MTPYNSDVHERIWYEGFRFRRRPLDRVCLSLISCFSLESEGTITRGQTGSGKLSGCGEIVKSGRVCCLLITSLKLARNDIGNPF